MAFTWSRIDNGTTADDIAAELEKSFAGVSRERASSDVKKAIDDLVALGLLQPQS
jgi:hypothetical protein